MNDPITWDAPDHDHPARRMAQRSFRAAAAGDKQAWVALFAPDAVIEDPVGPSPFDATGDGHHGPAGIAAFWDATIAGVDSLSFHITDSFANGQASASVGTITGTLAGGATIRTEGVFVHVVGADGLMTSMRAYWEWDRAMATLHQP